MEQILRQFRLEGRPVSCERYGEGHINLTCLVATDKPRRYILQRLSRAAFHDIPALMANVAAVTAFLASKNSDPRGIAVFRCKGFRRCASRGRALPPPWRC